MRRLLITIVPVLFLIACGPGAIGEACQGGAAENDCDEGALCTLEPSEEASPPDTPNNESFVCRQICDNNADCTEEGFTCQRANGTMQSSCQPDPNAEPPSDDTME